MSAWRCSQASPSGPNIGTTGSTTLQPRTHHCDQLAVGGGLLLQRPSGQQVQAGPLGVGQTGVGAAAAGPGGQADRAYPHREQGEQVFGDQASTPTAARTALPTSARRLPSWRESSRPGQARLQVPPSCDRRGWDAVGGWRVGGQHPRLPAAGADGGCGPGDHRPTGTAGSAAQATTGLACLKEVGEAAP
jgi:hypothetical protein